MSCIVNSHRGPEAVAIPCRRILNVGKLALISTAMGGSFGLMCLYSDHPSETALYYGAAIFLLTFSCFLSLVNRTEPRCVLLASPLTWAGVLYFVYFAPGTLWMLLSEEHSLFSPAVDYVPLAILLVSLGLFSMYAGYRIASRSASTDEERRSIYIKPERNEYYVVLLALLSFVTWYGRSVILRKGSLLSFGAFRYVSLSPWESVAVRMSYGSGLALIGLGAYLMYSGKGLRRWRPVGMVVVAAEVLYWTLRGARSQVAAVAIAYLVCVALVRGKWSKKVLVCGAVCVLGILVFTRGVREGVSYGVESEGVLEGSKKVVGAGVVKIRGESGGLLRRAVSRTLQKRVNGADLFAWVLYSRYERDAPFMYGSTARAALIAYTPRVLWAGKPTITDLHPETMVVANTGVTSPDTLLAPPCELFASFGVIGVIVGMFALGMVMKIVFRLLVYRPTTSIVRFLVFPVLCVPLVTVQQGFYATMFGSLREAIILVCCAWLLKALVGSVTSEHVNLRKRNKG